MTHLIKESDFTFFYCIDTATSNGHVVLDCICWSHLYFKISKY